MHDIRFCYQTVHVDQKLGIPHLQIKLNLSSAQLDPFLNLTGHKLIKVDKVTKWITLNFYFLFISVYIS